jgi:hypothetical protein
MRDTLFGDMPLDQFPKGGQPTDPPPWGSFVAARNKLRAGHQDEAIALWRSILELPNLESRHYLQAWHFLRHVGQKPTSHVAKHVLGIVVEVMLLEGLDLLAAYGDHSARYYNYSGTAVVWEHPDASLDPAIDALLSESQHVVAQIGPWENARPGPPQSGHARLSFLTPSGLHFGQGPLDGLSREPRSGRVMQLATALMAAMIGRIRSTRR